MAATLAAGMDTARPAATARDQLIRHTLQTKARRYLDRTGNGDVAEVLGLTGPAPQPGRPPTGFARSARAVLPLRECVVCAERYRPRVAGQRACSKSCASTLGRRTLRARKEATA